MLALSTSSLVEDASHFKFNACKYSFKIIIKIQYSKLFIVSSTLIQSQLPLFINPNITEARPAQLMLRIGLEVPTGSHE